MKATSSRTARTVEPLCEEHGARVLVALDERLVDEQLRLPDREPTTHDDQARGALVAPWQPTQGDGRT